MAPVADANPPSPLQLPLSLKSVAFLFEDDTSGPLWFKKDAFSNASFDPEAYISDLRRFVPFETLRAELRDHLGGLKSELVELINRDYADFVNLSTKLVDVDGAVLRMRMPLNELRGKLVSVRDNVNSTLLLLQDGLKRRSDASASRETLELLLDTCHVVSKVYFLSALTYCFVFSEFPFHFDVVSLACLFVNYFKIFIMKLLLKNYK